MHKQGWEHTPPGTPPEEPVISIDQQSIEIIYSHLLRQFALLVILFGPYLNSKILLPKDSEMC